MSLAKLIASVQPSRSNSGCATCQWISGLTPDDLEAFNSWLDQGLSIAQLHDICVANTDHPLTVSPSAFRNHLKRHHGLT